jgi:hypothetical protein
MRLWSLHPKYLDRIGLLALWRESLLAQKVLYGETKGYKNHPQLHRFKKHPGPEDAIASYLREVWKESQRRGYRFNGQKIRAHGRHEKISVTRGQLKHEFALLRERLQNRAPDQYQKLLSVQEIEIHPTFEVVEGTVEDWERTTFPPGID